jgi:hypothetical protein
MTRPDETTAVWREYNRAVNAYHAVMRLNSGATQDDKVAAKRRLQAAREAVKQMKARAAERARGRM